MEIYEETRKSEEELFNEEFGMYYDNKPEDTKDPVFSLSVFQIVLCLIMSAILFGLSMIGSFREKIIEGVEFIQSIEIHKSDIEDEISAARSYFTDAQA